MTFRYRVMPHGRYDATQANRFGLEQAQPLVHLAASKNAISKPLLALDGSPAVTVSVLKSTTEGNTVIVRLRSVSESDETVRLSWPAGNPRSLSLCRIEEIPDKDVLSEVTVPANGLVTLKAVW